jgi:hypothetical protein
MRLAILVALLAACGGPDVHEVVDCDPAWGMEGGMGCELACKTVPAYFVGGDAGTPCAAATHPEELSRSCSRTFEFEGARGCCVPMASQKPVQFFECL